MAMCLTRRRKNTVSGVSGAAGAAAFVGGSGGTTGSSRTYEGKSYAGTAHDSPTMVPVPLGSADSFGNRASQYPASFAGTADPYRDSLNMPSLPNAMPTNPGYGQPLSQYGGGSQYGMHDASVSQYGHPSNHTSYSPYDAQHASTASALAAATAAAAAGGAHLPYPGENSSNPAESRPPTVLPSAPQSFLAAPGQVVLSYAGAGASAVPDSSVGLSFCEDFSCSDLLFFKAGSSSSRSDVYTTKPSDASDEKRRLALAYRSEEEVDEPPPEYS
ncbi:hypothetical protein BDP27DRAFT_241398 [Rhodocollybia butyracea]|uniref:Uncharacterized protein n=1 Tax=Rhodocollybia butyracea TaxID=206335 RepID=A0A9P5PH73_9AGAR|nr:hypothetical protein BDP27DRAFT_241398 [Rhodocollybia butyracea]